MTPSPDYLSYEDIRERADHFLGEIWPDRSVPVDIEYITDVELGIDIVWTPHLLALTDVTGFITADGTEIRVDEDVAKHPKLYHYRFTIAEELGHLVLHGEFREAATYADPEGWLEFQNAIPEDDRRWLEWQAKCFAGLVLVPREALGEKVQEAVNRAKHLMDVDLEEESHRSYLAEWVGRRFEVSGEVILRRGKYDGHWSEY